MEALAVNRDYIMVRLNGDVKFNIYGIIEKVMDGTAFKYCANTGHLSITSEKYHKNSIFYLGLLDMISYSKETDGWFENKWFNGNWGDDPKNGHNQIESTLFYDELSFLLAEDLIRFDDIEFLTSDDIYRNAMAYFAAKENDKLAPLYACKTEKELISLYRKLCIENHPDKIGIENEFIRQLTETFAKLIKTFRNKTHK